MWNCARTLLSVNDLVGSQSCKQSVDLRVEGLQVVLNVECASECSRMIEFTHTKISACAGHKRESGSHLFKSLTEIWLLVCEQVPLNKTVDAKKQRRRLFLSKAKVLD